MECGRRQVRTGPSEGGPDQLILASHHHAAHGSDNYRETRCVYAAPGSMRFPLPDRLQDRAWLSDACLSPS